MQLEDYFNFISPLEIRIKGHRLDIEDIVRLYHEGYSAEQIALEFPGLSFEQIHATIAYYLHYKNDIDAYIVRRLVWEEQSIREEEAQEQPAVVKRLRSLMAQRGQERRVLEDTLSR